MPTPLNLPIQLKAQEASPQSHQKYERVPFGKEMLKQFSFDPEYHNVNHGMTQPLYNSRQTF